MSAPAERLDDLIADAMASWRPPPRLRLSEWAEEHFYLSAESAAEPGRWRTLPYQRGIMDAISDPNVERVTVMKSARVGATKILNATVGYYMTQDPCPILVVQPTVEDAEGYSKEEIAPMLRDCPTLGALFPSSATRDSSNTILHKIYPGGSLSMVGANSGRGFRRVSRKVVLMDEVDAYPPSAGAEGDQVKLAIRRSDFYWDRKIVDVSSPLVAGLSRIEDAFEAGDQRRFYIACPHCDHRDYLVFRREAERGHYMAWPDGPERAHFVCRSCLGRMEHDQKRALIEDADRRQRDGEPEIGWVAHAPFRGHASFHVWAAYSYSPNATWAQIAEEFLAASKRGVEQLKTFVNTWLGETWHDRGEAPAWERLYQRREPYAVGTVPSGGRFLTAGVDVQKDSLRYEVVAWGEGKESWSVDAGIIPGDTTDLGPSGPWVSLDALLARSFLHESGVELSVSMLAVDSSAFTQSVYTWARRHPMNRVMAIKGDDGHHRALVGAPSNVDVAVNGKRLARGYKVWPVGVDVAKTELYGWLRLERPTDETPTPPGYCHFPEYGAEFFQQLTAEQIVPRKKRNGSVVLAWEMIPGRENHFLDCRVYARAAAAVAGLDRFTPSDWAELAASAGVDARDLDAPPAPPDETEAPRTDQPQQRQPWIDRRGWLKPRR